MNSSLLAKKARLVQEVAGRLIESLDSVYRDSLVICLNRLDILSVRYLGSQNFRLAAVPQEVAAVSEGARPFGWAVWLAILSDSNLDDPEWILGGLMKGSRGWGFTQKEAHQWRREYIRAHLAPPLAEAAPQAGLPVAGAPQTRPAATPASGAGGALPARVSGRDLAH
jgi:hypothetical protein